MPDERLIKRRLPAVERKISEIFPERDVRVRLLGTVIDKGTNSIVLDDGTGKIDIMFPEDPYVNQGQLIRVVTRILPLLDGFECRGECIQTLDDSFNLDLYKKVREMVKNV